MAVRKLASDSFVSSVVEIVTYAGITTKENAGINRQT